MEFSNPIYIFLSVFSKDHKERGSHDCHQTAAQQVCFSFDPDYDVYLSYPGKFLKSWL